LNARWIGLREVSCALVQKAGCVMPTQMNGNGSAALRPITNDSLPLSTACKPSGFRTAS
jgi:hypothetical protein